MEEGDYSGALKSAKQLQKIEKQLNRRNPRSVRVQKMRLNQSKDTDEDYMEKPDKMMESK